MTRRLFLKRAGQAVGVVAFLPVLTSTGKVVAKNGNERYYEHTVLAMGTTARVGLYAKTEQEANAVINACFAELRRLESLFSLYDAQSEISLINTHAGKSPVSVSPDTISIIQSSIDFSKETRKAFDITVEPLMRLWGFRSESKVLHQLPTEKEVNAALQNVGYDQIELDPAAKTVRLRYHGGRLDLGGIAVGYALDKMAGIVRAAGVDRAFLDISGDMYAIGAPEGKHGWEVAIPDPNRPSRLIHHLTIKDEALATSGNYMSYVVYNAVHYGHIVDPREGRSAHKVLSATVISNRAIQADALSTASFVSGCRFGSTKLILVSPEGKIEEA